MAAATQGCPKEFLATAPSPNLLSATSKAASTLSLKPPTTGEHQQETYKEDLLPDCTKPAAAVLKSKRKLPTFCHKLPKKEIFFSKNKQVSIPPQQPSKNQNLKSTISSPAESNQVNLSQKSSTLSSFNFKNQEHSFQTSLTLL
ncbi:hypothetical protein ACOSQ2_029488 [Xanthoceras sorbifolium]